MEFIKGSCESFVNTLASNAPVPGGGGASALVGAVGIALGNMVASLTVGKKKYADVEADIIRLNEKADGIRASLLSLVQKDAEVFEPLSKAYGMPSETDKEKEEKKAVMEDALRTACTVPFEIMEECAKAIELQREFAEKGSRLAVSDAGVGVTLCKSAMQGASLNVFINTKLMADRKYAEEMNEKTQKMLSEYQKKADEVFEYVKEQLI